MLKFASIVLTFALTFAASAQAKDVASLMGGAGLGLSTEKVYQGIGEYTNTAGVTGECDVYITITETLASVGNWDLSWEMLNCTMRKSTDIRVSIDGRKVSSGKVVSIYQDMTDPVYDTSSSYTSSRVGSKMSLSASKSAYRVKLSGVDPYQEDIASGTGSYYTASSMDLTLTSYASGEIDLTQWWCDYTGKNCDGFSGTFTLVP